ncbi:MAG: inositol monophosphatase family protein, partial [Myxococcales bacterium]
MAAPDAAALEHARQVAESVARDAGRLLLEGWGTRPKVEFKSEDINLVTEFDRRSEALIVARLAAAFPDDTVVGEEGSEVGARGRHGGGRIWYVDPLDGTTNFSHGFPLFSVS